MAGRPAGQFSLGMSQRLGIASALLGDPATVMLDEPVNGLDPEGILWIRGLLRSLADEGRTVFVSSHLMSEMALTAEHFVIVGRGRLIADVTARQLEAMAPAADVLVRTPDGDRLRAALALDGVTVGDEPAPAPDIAVAGIVLHDLVTRRNSLEQTFMELAHGAAEYGGHEPGTVTPLPNYRPSNDRKAA